MRPKRAREGERERERERERESERERERERSWTDALFSRSRSGRPTSLWRIRCIQLKAPPQKELCNSRSRSSGYIFAFSIRVPSIVAAVFDLQILRMPIWADRRLEMTQ